MKKPLHFLLVILLALAKPFLANAKKEMRIEGISAQAPLSEYSGSQACAACHQGIYDTWKTRAKGSFVRYRKDIKGEIPVAWQNSPIREEDIYVVVGKRRKMAFVDKDWRVIPYEFKLKKGKWKKRDGWARHNYDYRERCAPCHTVALDRHSLNFKELNVGCEACHGPGKKHAQDPAAKIAVPGKGTDLQFMCRKCHNSRKNHARALDNFSGDFHKK